MVEIGNRLKERREELGFTLKEMSDKTRVPVYKLQAIENGDLKFFENDLTYLKFYIRYYCNALHLDFEMYRDQLDLALDEFSNTTKMLKISELNDIHDRVSDRVSKSTRRKRLDISFISFATSIVLLVLTLVLVFVFLILPNLNKEDDLIIDNGNSDIPSPIENVDDEETEVVEVPKVLSVSQIDSVNYEVTGFSDGQDLSLFVNFKSNAYVKIRVDGDSAVNLPNKLYNVGSTLDFKFSASNETIVEVYIGWMNGNTMLINDIAIPIDEEIAKRNGSVTFTFRLRGETE